LQLQIEPSSSVFTKITELSLKPASSDSYQVSYPSH